MEGRVGACLKVLYLDNIYLKEDERTRAHHKIMVGNMYVKNLETENIVMPLGSLTTSGEVVQLSAQLIPTISA